MDLMDCYFIQWVIVNYSHDFNVQIIPDLVSEISFKLACFHLIYPPYSSLFLFMVQQDFL